MKNNFDELNIGTQIWATQNLDVNTFKNGEPIHETKTDEEWETAGRNRKPACCYYNNDPANGKQYGKLYNFYAATDQRGLAPKGWHVPSDAEWKNLTDYLGGENLGEKKDSSAKMKSTSGWDESNGNGTNESGFTALPGGCRIVNGSFYEIGSNCYFWSATEESNPDARFRANNDGSCNDGGREGNFWPKGKEMSPFGCSLDLAYMGARLYREPSFKSCGFSIRCVKDRFI